MKKVVLAKMTMEEAEKLYHVSEWEPYDTIGPAIEKWKLDPPELRQEAVFIKKGCVTVRSMGIEYNLQPGHMITLDTGVEFYWIVEESVEAVWKHDTEI
ncbi:MAG: hypothetical protein ACOX7J_03595 [Bacillota bacterium]|jgi:hypothetical protein